jgi:hypothetical protein
MDRVGWLLTSIFVVLSTLVSFAQQDSLSKRRIQAAVGIDLTLAMASTPAVGGHVKLRSGRVELTTSYGRNRACLTNVRGFDELEIAGEWIEADISVVVPFWNYGFRADRLEGFRLSVGIGSAHTELEYREIFESLPPFQDLVYRETDSQRGQKFTSFALGFQYEPVKNISVGYGLVGYYLWDRPDGPFPVPLVVTPFSARSPIGLYGEFSYVF